MNVAVNRRSTMTLFSHPMEAESHRVRLVMAEKGITSLETVELRDGEHHEDLLDLNPYNTIPTLVDRELVLYESRIIIEYLDERFPHPPLMPIDPVSRARFRLALYRIEMDLYAQMAPLGNGDKRAVRAAKKRLREALVAGAAAFAAKPFFLSDEFSLVDCSLAPILWRLHQYNIELPDQARPVQEYAQRLFERDGFKRSLSQGERELSPVC
jgi:RNA polymerase-associated protein